MSRRQTTGRDVATELEVAVRRFNVNVRRAIRSGMRFKVQTRRSERKDSGLLYLDLLAAAPVLEDLPPMPEHDRCEAWIDLVEAAAEINRLLETAGEKAGLALRIGEPTAARRAVTLRVSDAVSLAKIGRRRRAGVVHQAGIRCRRPQEPI